MFGGYNPGQGGEGQDAQAMAAVKNVSTALAMPRQRQMHSSLDWKMLTENRCK